LPNSGSLVRIDKKSTNKETLEAVDEDSELKEEEEEEAFCFRPI
jgi:hypothetical protein